MSLLSSVTRTLRSSSPFWVALQQFATRGIVALKFLVVGRILGPSAIGEVVVALLALSLVEALTQLGIEPSVVQARDELSPAQRNAAWSMQLIRGALIGAALAIFSGFIGNAFGSPASSKLVAVAALIPLFRNGVSIGYIDAQRNRRFRPVGALNMAGAVVDVATSALLIAFGAGVIGVLLGTVIAEGTRFMLSHVVFPARVTLVWRPAEIPNLLGYGRWIWAGGLLAAALDQIDKAVIGVWLGVEQLGYYQMAGRLAQLAVAEFGMIVGRYLFPTIALQHRTDPRQVAAIVSLGLNLVLQVSALVVLTMETVGKSLLLKFLGPEWFAMFPYLRVLLLASVGNGVHSVFASFLRAVGRPQAVVYATAIQIVNAVVLYALLGPWLRGIGVAAATAVSMGVAIGALAVQARVGRLSANTLVVVALCASVGVLSAARPGMEWTLFVIGGTGAVCIAFRSWRAAIGQFRQP